MKAMGSSLAKSIIILPTYEECQEVYSVCHSIRPSICSFVRSFDSYVKVLC